MSVLNSSQRVSFTSHWQTDCKHFPAKTTAKRRRQPSPRIRKREEKVWKKSFATDKGVFPETFIEWNSYSKQQFVFTEDKGLGVADGKRKMGLAGGWGGGILQLSLKEQR